MRKTFLFIAVVGLLSCGENPAGRGDENSNYKYAGKIITIGNQKWMARNLNRVTPNSKCLEDSPDSCAKYGRLYNWDDTKTVCPSGWHLPSDAEWQTLINSVGGADSAGMKLKSISGWSEIYDCNGTDEYDFSALPGSGYNFMQTGYNGFWWSATETGYSTAYRWMVSCADKRASHYEQDKIRMFSVRCVQD